MVYLSIFKIKCFITIYNIPLFIEERSQFIFLLLAVSLRRYTALASYKIHFQGLIPAFAAENITLEVNKATESGWAAVKLR